MISFKFSYKLTLLLFISYNSFLGIHCSTCTDVNNNYRCNQVSDKWVSLKTWYNDAPVSISESISTTIGNSNTRASNQGEHNSKTIDAKIGASVGVNAGINYVVSAGVQASFEASLGISSTTGHDWSKSTSSTFDSQTTEVKATTCPARHKCELLQAVGYCDSCEFRISRYKILTELIYPNGTKPEPREQPISDAFEGEISITIKNVTYSDRSGNWERSDSCQGGTRVHGFQLKSQRGHGMTGFMLLCAGKDETSGGLLQNKTQIQSGEGTIGTWRAPFLSYFKDTHATGFAYQTWESARGDRYKGNWKLIMEGEKTPFILPDWAVNVQVHPAHCPKNHEICGIQTMLTADKKVVTDIGFKCCYHCEPREAYVVRESYTNNAGNAATLHYSWTEGISDSKDKSRGGNGNTDNSTTGDGIQYDGIQAGFEAKFGSSSSQGFNWAMSSSQMWNSGQTRDIRWKCPGYHQCVLKQLVGFCGNKEIVRTPHKRIDTARVPNFVELITEFNALTDMQAEGSNDDIFY